MSPENGGYGPDLKILGNHQSVFESVDAAICGLFPRRADWDREGEWRPGSGPFYHDMVKYAYGAIWLVYDGSISKGYYADHPVALLQLFVHYDFSVMQLHAFGGPDTVTDAAVYVTANLRNVLLAHPGLAAHCGYYSPDGVDLSAAADAVQEEPPESGARGGLRTDTRKGLAYAEWLLSHGCVDSIEAAFDDPRVEGGSKSSYYRAKGDREVWASVERELWLLDDTLNRAAAARRLVDSGVSTPHACHQSVIRQADYDHYCGDESLWRHEVDLLVSELRRRERQ